MRMNPLSPVHRNAATWGNEPLTPTLQHSREIFFLKNEASRQQIGHVYFCNLIGPLHIDEQNGQLRRKLRQHLSTRATRRDTTSRSNRQACKLLLAIGYCRKDRRALGAIRQTIRGIFDIAADELLTSRCNDRSSHQKLRIGRKRPLAHRQRRLDQGTIFDR